MVICERAWQCDNTGCLHKRLHNPFSVGVDDRLCSTPGSKCTSLVAGKMTDVYCVTPSVKVISDKQFNDSADAACLSAIRRGACPVMKIVPERPWEVKA